jgi:hypothetical protein
MTSKKSCSVEKYSLVSAVSKKYLTNCPEKLKTTCMGVMTTPNQE